MKQEFNGLGAALRVVVDRLAVQRRFLLATVGMLLPLVSAAQQTNHFTEYVKTITSAKNVQPQDFGLFGDKVSLYTGSTEFSVVDVSLPGNSGLPVALGRRYEVEDKTGIYRRGAVSSFGDWVLDVPYLHGMFARSTGWISRIGPLGHQRCSINASHPDWAMPPPTTDAQTGNTWFGGDEYWHGNFLHLPGQGDQEMMIVNPSNPTRPSSGGPYYWITKEQWFFSCLPGTASGTQGEAFVAIAPDGTEYRFDWFFAYSAPQMEKPHGMGWFEVVAQPGIAEGEFAKFVKKSPGISTSMLQANFAFLARSEVKIYPTQVTDRFGNKVVYTFDPTTRRLKRIEGFTPSGASDGRRIDIEYNNETGLISHVKAGTRTWIYTYSGSTLESVTLPDKSSWQYTLGGLASAHISAQLVSSDCGSMPMDPDQYQSSYAGTIKHPSGAVGTFTFRPTLHSRSRVPRNENCIMVSYDDGVESKTAFIAIVPPLFSALSIREKRITGAGLPDMSWNYAYSAAVSCWHDQQCPETKTTTVTSSSGIWERHTFSNRLRVAEGMTERLDVGKVGSGPGAESSIVYGYKTNADGQLFPARVGVTPFARGDRVSENLVPMINKRTVRDGRYFIWQVLPGCDGAALCLDRFARPTKIKKTSQPISP